MSEYTATVCWERDGQPFTDNRYSRAHRWQFDGGLEVPASASPHIVPLPMSVEQNVDPEEAFIAALSSCHMLFFLSFAAAEGYVVDTYRDQALGTMGKDENNRRCITRVALRPAIEFSGIAPTAEMLQVLHDKSHHHCFIANSVKTEIVIEAVG